MYEVGGMMYEFTHLQMFTELYATVCARAKGFPISISLINSENEASLKATEKTSGRRLGITHTTYFLGYISRSLESDNEENLKQNKTLFNLD